MEGMRRTILITCRLTNKPGHSPYGDSLSGNLAQIKTKSHVDSVKLPELTVINKKWKLIESFLQGYHTAYFRIEKLSGLNSWKNYLHGSLKKSAVLKTGGYG
jgi:hypothetical protein